MPNNIKGMRLTIILDNYLFQDSNVRLESCIGPLLDLLGMGLSCHIMLAFPLRNIFIGHRRYQGFPNYLCYVAYILFNCTLFSGITEVKGAERAWASEFLCRCFIQKIFGYIKG